MTPETNARWVGRRPKHARRHLRREADLRSRLPDRGVREAVLRTRPLHRFSFDRRLFHLARSLRFIDPAASAEDWRAVVRVWHDLAGPCAARSPAGTWAEFARLYSAARTKPGVALDAVMAGAVSVLDVARRMARFFGTVWTASCRQIGGWMGVSHETARRRVDAAVREGTVRRLVPGTPSATLREAATYSSAPLFAPADRSGQPGCPNTLTSLAFPPLATPASPADLPPAGGGGLPCVNPLKSQEERHPPPHPAGRAATTPEDDR